MTILIVEDEPLAAKNLVRQIQAYDESYDILPVADTIRQGVRLLEKHRPDLLFLDIQLSDGLSFDILKQTAVPCPIIFTTAYDEFALRAFDHNSIAYLLKPITEEKIRQAFQKLERLKKSFQPEAYTQLFQTLSEQLNSPKYKENFLVKKGRKLIPISVDQIAYFFSEDKYVFILTQDNQRYLCNYSLTKLEQLLDPRLFFRLSRQYLAGRQAIRRLEFYAKGQVSALIEPGGEKVVVSRQQTSELKEWMEV